MSAVLKCPALHMMPFVLSTSQSWVYFCQTLSLLFVHFQVFWLIIAVIGLFKGLIVLNVNITLAVGSPANSVDMF